MKVVFLDIDGVLNSNQFWENCKNIDEEIDDTAVARLAKIVNATNSIIVLSSSWRELREENEIKQYMYNKLKAHNLTIYDQTPRVQSNRPLEIKTWLIDHKDLNIEGFVSLDDDFDEIEYEKVGIPNRTIHTSFYDKNNGGLTNNHINMAIKILNTPCGVIE